MSARFRHQDAKSGRFCPVPTSRILPRGPIGTANPRGLRGGSRFRISRYLAEAQKTAREVPRGKAVTTPPHHPTGDTQPQAHHFGVLRAGVCQ